MTVSGDYENFIINHMLRGHILITQPAQPYVNGALWHTKPHLLLKRRLERLTPGQVLVHGKLHITRSDHYKDGYVIGATTYSLADAVAYALENSDRELPPLELELTATQRRVLAEWKRQTNEGDAPTVSSVMDKTGYSWRITKGAIRMLVNRGYMKRVKAGRYKVAYTLTEKGEQA